jgi:hypothetical protein
MVSMGGGWRWRTPEGIAEFKYSYQVILLYTLPSTQDSWKLNPCFDRPSAGTLLGKKSPLSSAIPSNIPICSFRRGSTFANSLVQHAISSYFNTESIEFKLLKIQYQKGEIITPPHDYFLFVIEGGIRVYSLLNDGLIYLINQSKGFIVLGDTAIADRIIDTNFTEASVDDTHCLGFEMARYKPPLMEDAKFLRFVIKSLTDELFSFSPDESRADNLKIRLTHHFRMNYQNKTIINMKDLAMAFHISNRHLQRVLCGPVQDGKILKIKKGIYRLTEPSIAVGRESIS